MQTDIAIVGLGPAGIAAALALTEAGLRPTLIDATPFEEGAQPTLARPSLAPAAFADPKVFSLAQKSQSALDLQVKSQAPLWQLWGEGGLTQAWGGGLFEYSEVELSRMGLNRHDLSRHYQAIARELPIHGGVGQRSDVFRIGSEQRKPVALTPGFPSYPQVFDESCNWGDPAIALQDPAPSGEREIFSIGGLLKTHPRLRSLPRIKGFSVKALSGSRLISTQGQELSFQYVILALGTVSTACLMLRSFGQEGDTLRIYDTPCAQLPYFSLQSRFESKPKHHVVERSVLFRSENQEFLLNFMPFTSAPLEALVTRLPDFIPDGVKRPLIRHLRKRAIAGFLFAPTHSEHFHEIGLHASGQISTRMVHSYQIPPQAKRWASHALSYDGFYSHRAWVRDLPPGSGIHYVGTLAPTAPNTPFGRALIQRLRNLPNLCTVDGSVLYPLPAKNHTLTLMAHAHAAALTFSKEIRHEKSSPS